MSVPTQQFRDSNGFANTGRRSSDLNLARHCRRAEDVGATILSARFRLQDVSLLSHIVCLPSLPGLSPLGDSPELRPMPI